MVLTAFPYTGFVHFKSHENFKKRPFFGKGAQTFTYNCIYFHIIRNFEFSYLLHYKMAIISV